MRMMADGGDDGAHQLMPTLRFGKGSMYEAREVELMLCWQMNLIQLSNSCISEQSITDQKGQDREL